MAILYKCDNCDELYSSYTEAFECHEPLDYTRTWWEQLMIEDEAEMDCE